MDIGSAVDESYLLALHDHDELYPISDEAYAEELQIQEILITSSPLTPLLPSSSASSSSLNISQLQSVQSSSSTKWVEENVQSSSSWKFCSICMDNKPSNEFFSAASCTHSFCTDCIGQYVATKIQENISMVKCPNTNCEETISSADCRDVVPKQVLERWETALVESLMLVSGNTLYCPFKDCSALLLNDDAVAGSTECPSCHRLFCTQCEVGWHDGLECAEFQRLGKGERKEEDVLAVKLAKDKKWRRCPKCMYYVEKSSGCLHISCRCSYHFCYACGSKWNETHACS